GDAALPGVLVEQGGAEQLPGRTAAAAADPRRPDRGDDGLSGFRADGHDGRAPLSHAVPDGAGRRGAADRTGFAAAGGGGEFPLADGGADGPGRLGAGLAGGAPVPQLRGAVMTRPLEGRTVALAEGRQLEELAELLEREGAATFRCPMLSILDAPDPAPVT